MITIDGSRGEGGGQVLRTTIALSLVTGTPVRITDIRAGRKKPGLMRQHRAALLAAAQVGAAQLTGADLGSREVTFEPTTIQGGPLHVSVGTAGSTGLVLHTVLPALLMQDQPCHLVFEGGTHNPMAPPFDHLQRTYLPLIECMGARATATLTRPGYFPAGGGRFEVHLEPTGRLEPLEIHDRGQFKSRLARATVAGIPDSVASRELEVIGKRLAFRPFELEPEVVPNSPGPGNVVQVFLESKHVTETFTAFGRPGRPAEAVARSLCDEVRQYLAHHQPIGPHTADQLVLLLALAGGGSFRTGPPTRHLLTQIDLIPELLPVSITLDEFQPRRWQVDVTTRA